MKKTISVIAIFIAFLFSGCIQNINQQGLTIKVPASQITQSLEQQFPISQDFEYGKVTLTDPKAMLSAGSNRIQAGTTIGFSSTLLPKQTGSLFVSGKPFFDAKSGAVYLREPNIEKLEFNGYKLASFMKGPLTEAIIPIINEVFRTRPIYQLNKNSIQNSFVNDIKVSNGFLLITFGL